ncbi:hypothetical protein PENSPDRAFT_254203 [Peniophora sp. CONT]|nr:hypothetical protein PENSPDRAFT_254203 [Peniophora sp. CONT]
MQAPERAPPCGRPRILIGPFRRGVTGVRVRMLGRRRASHAPNRRRVRSALAEPHFPRGVFDEKACVLPSWTVFDSSTTLNLSVTSRSASRSCTLSAFTQSMAKVEARQLSHEGHSSASRLVSSLRTLLILSFDHHARLKHLAQSALSGGWLNLPDNDN